jgi:hypothetical protein
MPLISAYISLLIIDESERQWIVKYFPRDRIQVKTVKLLLFSEIRNLA